MRIILRIVGLVCWTVTSPAPGAEAAETNPGSARSSGLPAPPAPPIPQSPLAEFRQLLALNPQELQQTLAGRTSPQREFLQAKLAEYASLTPDERELRLRATELWWYLRPLLGLAATNRAERLEQVPEDFRSLVEQRLKQWEQLTPDLQKEVLENEWTIRYFRRLESATPATRDRLMSELPPERRGKVEADLDRWRALPPERRERMCAHFEQFFELSPKEREKTLGVFSEAERREMEKTLRAFEQLPADQRRLCLESFRRFTDMTPEERAQFLKNVDRWKAMTAAERDSWRRLVRQLPPLPPGASRPPLPPVPPPLPRARSLGTNAGG